MSDDIDYDALLADAPSPEHIQIVAFEGLQYGLIDVEQYTAMHDAIRALRAAAVESKRDAAVLLSLLKKARDEFAGLPHSLGYEFTHLPEIDAAIATQEKAQQPAGGAE